MRGWTDGGTGHPVWRRIDPMLEEDLLGYLLNAVEPAQRRRIAARLKADPHLRRKLESLRSQLSAGSHEAQFDPPPGLREQTCNLVEGCHQHRLARGDVRLGGSESLVCCRQWSLRDVIVAAGVFLAAAMLFFPALANSRYRSHIDMCQRNLQQLGQALCEFSEIHAGQFPSVAVSGNRAAAGVYAPILVDDGYLIDTRVLVCPGSPLAENVSGWRVPTLAELDRARDRTLEQLKSTMGGSYGYTLGYVAGDRYQSPRSEGRDFFALMSDAPSLHLAGRRSSNHCGRGQNVLFEDFHVAFVADPDEAFHPPIARNALFVNRYGYAEAGADKNDTVIGGSGTPPLLIPSATKIPVKPAAPTAAPAGRFW